MAKSKKSHFKLFLDVVTSPRLTLTLFALLIIFLIPATFLQQGQTLHFLNLGKIFLAFIFLNLAVCTIYNIKTLRLGTIVLHLGTLIILTGSFISTFGYIATVNIYENSVTDTVYRWDTEEDVHLDFDLRINKVHMSYYPVPVKIGILKNGEKSDLITTTTDNSFVVDGYRIQVTHLDPVEKKLHLALETHGGNPVGIFVTSGQNTLPKDFPLDFKLVAYKDPTVRRMWVDLDVLENGEIVASGTSEVNSPLKWQGMLFFLTSVSADEYGNSYAGIQITKDPGLPLVYTGFFVFFIGLLLSLKRWSATCYHQSRP